MGIGMGLLLLVAALAGPTAEAVESNALSATLRFTEHGDEKTITRENLLRIQKFIIEQGHRQTYCNMYNDNPAYSTTNFQFYLNPDTGQANGDCDLEKSGFHSLTIHRSGPGWDQYRQIDFLHEGEVLVGASYPRKDLTVRQIRQFAADAVAEILATIDGETVAVSESQEAAAATAAAATAAAATVGATGDIAFEVGSEFPESPGTIDELRQWAASTDGRVVAQEHGLVGVVVYDFGGIGYGRVGVYRQRPSGLELITATQELLLPEVSAGSGGFSINYRVEETIDPASIP